MAAQEFDEAIEWYELQSKGLGKRFKKSVTNQLKKIKQNPDWFLVEGNKGQPNYYFDEKICIMFVIFNPAIFLMA